jgi:ribonuclease J
MLKTSYTSKLIEKLQIESATVIYAMWAGYLTEKHNPQHYKEYEILRQKLGNKFIEIHCSGHGYVEDLKKMAEAVNPKVLVPIHTEHADEYCNYFKNVKQEEIIYV